MVGELRCRAGRESKGVAGRTVRVRQADDTVRRYHFLFSCRDFTFTPVHVLITGWLGCCFHQNNNNFVYLLID